MSILRVDDFWIAIPKFDCFADDPLGDPKAEGDPYCSLFVGRLSAQTDEKSLHEVLFVLQGVDNGVARPVICTDKSSTRRSLSNSFVFLSAGYVKIWQGQELATGASYR